MTTPKGLFERLAIDRGIYDAGVVADPALFSKPIMPVRGGITIRNMAIKTAGSPLIIPPLLSQFTAAVGQMVVQYCANPTHDFDAARMCLFASQKVLKCGETNLNGTLHTDIYNFDAAMRGREQDVIYLVSDVPHLTARIYPHAVAFTDAEKQIFCDDVRNKAYMFQKMLGQKIDTSHFVQTDAYRIYVMDVSDPHYVPLATGPTPRTVLSAHIAPDCPIQSAKARQKARPFLFDDNPDLAAWVRQHTARPQDYGLWPLPSL
ncbi:MAG: hypothetical protein V4621_05315 [Pseudomonadota bacterium]